MNPSLDDINLETQKIMLKQKNGSIRVLNATEIGDLEVLDSLGGSDDEWVMIEPVANRLWNCQ